MLHLGLRVGLSYRCASVLTERVAETVWRSVQVEFAGSVVDIVWRGRWGRGRVPLVPFGSGWNGVPLVPLGAPWCRGRWSGVPLVPLAVIGRLRTPLVPLTVVGFWRVSVRAPLVVPLAVVGLGWRDFRAPLVPLSVVVLWCWWFGVPLVPLVWDRWSLRPD